MILLTFIDGNILENATIFIFDDLTKEKQITKSIIPLKVRKY